MALLGWPGQSLVDIRDTLHITFVHLPKCPANKIGALSVFVFYHFPNVPSWGYSAPPGKPFPGGSLEPTIGLLLLLFECKFTLSECKIYRVCKFSYNRKQRMRGGSVWVHQVTINRWQRQRQRVGYRPVGAIGHK